MTPEENKALAQRAIEEIWNKGNLAVALEVYGPSGSSFANRNPVRE